MNPSKQELSSYPEFSAQAISPVESFRSFESLQRSCHFSVPFYVRIPAYCYLVIALSWCILVFVGFHSSPDSPLARWTYQSDSQRMLSSVMYASVLLCSAIGTLLSVQLQGLIIHPDGVELRLIRFLGIPSVERLRWSEVQRVIVRHDKIRFETWNHRWIWGPTVVDSERLIEKLSVEAARRGFRIEIFNR